MLLLEKVSPAVPPCFIYGKELGGAWIPSSLANTYHCFYQYSSGKNNEDWTTGHMTESSRTAIK